MVRPGLGLLSSLRRSSFPEYCAPRRPFQIVGLDFDLDSPEGVVTVLMRNSPKAVVRISSLRSRICVQPKQRTPMVLVFSRMASQTVSSWVWAPGRLDVVGSTFLHCDREMVNRLPSRLQAILEPRIRPWWTVV